MFRFIFDIDKINVCNKLTHLTFIHDRPLWFNGESPVGDDGIPWAYFVDFCLTCPVIYCLSNAVMAFMS